MQTPTVVKIDPYELELHAYELWLAAGSPIGSDLEFWVQAEAELRSANSHALPASPCRM